MKEQLTIFSVKRKYIVTWQEAEKLLSNKDFKSFTENNRIVVSLEIYDDNLHEITFKGTSFAYKEKESLYITESIATNLEIVSKFAEKIINGA